MAAYHIRRDVELGGTNSRKLRTLKPKPTPAAPHPLMIDPTAAVKLPAGRGINHAMGGSQKRPACPPELSVRAANVKGALAAFVLVWPDTCSLRRALPLNSESSAIARRRCEPMNCRQATPAHVPSKVVRPPQGRSVSIIKPSVM